MDQIDQLDAALSVLMRVLTVDERRTSAKLGAKPFNPVDLETLSFLHRFPNSAAKEVATHLGVGPTTMQSVIDRLHKREMVARDASVLKGRAVGLRLTKEGMKFRKQIQLQNLANCAEMLNCLRASERDVFVKNVATIAERLNDTAQAP